MGKQRDLYTRWKRAKQVIAGVFEKAEHTVVIHYSCESFYDREDPRSPRVTSIAVRNLDSGQTKSFSIHLIAERLKLLDDVEAHLDELEVEMLREFFEHARLHQHCTWLHWNMRDANYGFEALENRIKALGGTPVVVPEANRQDLSRLLVSIYGVGYIAHPRLERLMEKNKITPKDFLTGKGEAAAFESKELLKLHQSTLRKVDVLANIAQRANVGDLKTEASWWDLNGRTFKAAGEWIREHWLIGALIAVIGLITALVKAWPFISTIF